MRLVILAFACAIYFYGLGALALVGPDEPRYAQIAREMMMRHDFVTPTLGGSTWFEKPALPYWAMRLGFHLFANQEYAARFGSALTGLVTIAAVMWTGGKGERRKEKGEVKTKGYRSFTLLLNSSFATLGAGVAAACLGLTVFARAASFDIYITAAIACVVACFFAAETADRSDAIPVIDDSEVNHLTPDDKAGLVNEKRNLNAKRDLRRTLYVALCYAAMGVALLAKGLIGVVLPVGIFALYFALQRTFPRRFWWRSLTWGWLLTLAVASLWYAPVIARHGMAFVDEFFIQHHFARYVSNKYRHPQPVYFYVPVMFAFALPFSLVLVAGIFTTARDVWRNLFGRDFQPPSSANRAVKNEVNNNEANNDEAKDKYQLKVLAFAWMIFPVAFFSVSGSKLPGYILPALPGAALLIALHLAQLETESVTSVHRKQVKSLIATGALMIIAGAGGAGFAFNQSLISAGEAVLIGLSVVLGGVFAIVFAARPQRCAWTIIASTMLTLAFAVGFATDEASNRFSIREQLREASVRGYADAPLVTLYALDRTAEFYAANRIIYDANGEPRGFGDVGEIARFMKEKNLSQVLLMTNHNGLPQLRDSSELSFEIIGSNSEVTLAGMKIKNG